MRKLYLSLGLIALALCAGCGSDSNNNPPPTPTGNFSNASLSGQYVYQVSGFDFSSGTGVPYVRAGVFSANGAGALTTVVDDFSEGSATSSTISGTYSISNDGTGSLVFSFPSGSLTYAITLVSSSKVYLAEADTTFSGGGIAEKQDTTAFAAAPSGTFVFKRRSLTTGGTPTSYVGSFSLSAGTITTGANSQDSLVFGSTLTSVALSSALFNTPDATLGRASGTITDGSAVSTTFIYYVVDANNLRFLTTDGGVTGLGRAERQSTTTFTNASLNGPFAFGASGDTTSLFGGIRTAGRFMADGNGGITAGAFDNVTDGNVTLNSAFTGSYTMAATGRAAVTIGSGSQIYWMVSPTRAFFLTNSSTQLSDGTADAQVGSNFSNASVNGQFAFLMNGFTIQTGGSTSTLDRVATLQFDGKGGLILNEFVNSNGSTSTTGFLTGTYTVSSNGRITGTIPGATNTIGLSMYLVSSSNAYIIDNDTGFELDGQINLQQ
ncbi:MAG TPA: hypothetical protein VFA68_21565 [Terriglobales bacterium]|nr:hypothetical protein [Terriglobales bacterium]